MKKQRPELIRTQPSLGETLASKGIEEGTRGFFSWLSNRGGKKKLEERVAVLEQKVSDLAFFFTGFKAGLDSRLKEIESCQDELLDWARTQKEREAKNG